MRIALCGGLAILLMLSACGGTEPGPPEPTVSALELEMRLDEHLSRLVAGTMDPDESPGPVTRSRQVGCAALRGGGPDWGVVPRVELTVTVSEHAHEPRNEAYEHRHEAHELRHEVDLWLLRNGFTTIRSTGWSLEAAGADGVSVLVEHSPTEASQFTIAATAPCGWPPERDGGPPTSGRLAPLPAPAGPDQAVTTNLPGRPAVTDAGGACGSPNRAVFNRDAPPFTGPGPHPMYLFGGIGGNYREFYLSREWAPGNPGVRDPDPSTVQLLVCVRAVPTVDTGQDVTCYYSSSPLQSGSPTTFDLFDSTYQVLVRQARDGAVVGEFSIAGSVSGERACPTSLAALPSMLLRGINEPALIALLRPLYEQDR